MLFREVKIATLIFRCKKSNFVTGKAFLFLSESSGTSLYVSLIVVAVVVVVEGKWSGAPFGNLTQNSEQQFSVLWFDAEIFFVTGRSI